MKYAKNVIFGLLFILTIFGLARAAEPDIKGGKDHPLLTKMPGFHI
jgi:hypothetical protein